MTNRRKYEVEVGRSLTIKQRVEGDGVNFTYELTLTPTKAKKGVVSFDAEGWIRNIYSVQRDRPVEW